MPLDEHRAANRANWDDRVAIHLQPDGYDPAKFVADPSRISGVVPYDRRFLPDVDGKTLLHLQCHFGHDTLSWARLWRLPPHQRELVPAMFSIVATAS